MKEEKKFTVSEVARIFEVPEKYLVCNNAKMGEFQ